MDTNHPHGHPLENPEVGYDHSDLSVRGIIIFLVGVAAAGVITHLVIWGAFIGAQKIAPYQQDPNPMATTEKIPAAPPLQNAGPQTVVKFPEPKLQTDDTADMSKFKAAEEMELHPSKPFQTADGAIHIDIDDAMKIIAERGLPTRQAVQTNQVQTQPTPKAPEAPRSAGSTAGAQ